MCFGQRNAQMSLSKCILTTQSSQCHPYRAERPVSEIFQPLLRRTQRFPRPCIRFVDRICTKGGGKKCCTGPPYLVLLQFEFYHRNLNRNGAISGAVPRIIDFQGPKTFVSRLPHFFSELQTLLRTAEKDLCPSDISIFTSNGANSLP